MLRPNAVHPVLELSKERLRGTVTVPKRLRPFLDHRPDVTTGVLRILVRAIRTTLIAASSGAPRNAQIGAVSFLHRFGASLNPHFHFHLIVLDGVVTEEADGSVHFHETAGLTAQQVNALTETVQRRILRYFHRHGILDRHVTDDMLTWQGTGGFSLDASVRVEGTDRAAGGSRAAHSLPRTASLRHLRVGPRRAASGPGHGLGARPVARRCTPEPERRIRTHGDRHGLFRLELAAL